MKKVFLTAIICLLARYAFAEVIFHDSFEYANTEGNTPVGWYDDAHGWASRQFEHEHNCKPHNGNWYAYTQADEAWLFTPVTFLTHLHYQVSLWTVSEGAFQLEMCYCRDKTPESAETIIMPLSEVNFEEYQEMRGDIEPLETLEGYFGIHVIKAGGTALCIDDVTIAQTFQYAFEVKAVTTDTIALEYGETAYFKFNVYNIGYDTETLTLYGSDEMFTDIHFTCEGEEVGRFDIAPNEVKSFDVEATLRNEECPYPIAWIDVIVSSTHNCNTGMATFYAHPKKPTSVSEQSANVQVFPNPCSDFMKIEVSGFQQVTIYDVNGRCLLQSHETQLDLRALPSGRYFMTINTDTQSFSQQFLKR